MFKIKTMLLSLALLLTQIQLQAADDHDDCAITEKEAHALLNDKRYSLHTDESWWKVGGPSREMFGLKMPGYPEERRNMAIGEESDLSPAFLRAIKPLFLQQSRDELKKIDLLEALEYITQLEKGGTSQHISKESKEKLKYKQEQMQELLNILTDAYGDVEPGSSIPEVIKLGSPADELERAVCECDSYVRMIWIAELISNKDTTGLISMLEMFDVLGVRLPSGDRTHIEQFAVAETRLKKGKQKQLKRETKQLNKQLSALGYITRTLKNWDQISENEDSSDEDSSDEE